MPTHIRALKSRILVNRTCRSERHAVNTDQPASIIQGRFYARSPGARRIMLKCYRMHGYPAVDVPIFDAPVAIALVPLWTYMWQFFALFQVGATQPLSRP